MKRHVVSGILLLAAWGEPPPAQAQQYDGTWTGQAAQWTLTLVVAGTKARLTMACGGTALGSMGLIVDFGLGPDGLVDTYVMTGAGRRHITGNLPDLNVPPPGGLCGSGIAKMIRK